MNKFVPMTAEHYATLSAENKVAQTLGRWVWTATPPTKEMRLLVEHVLAATCDQLELMYGKDEQYAAAAHLLNGFREAHHDRNHGKPDGEDVSSYQPTLKNDFSDQ